MSMSLAFWILMLLWLVLAVYGGRGQDWRKVGYWVDTVPFLAILLLGWRVFGAPIQ